MSPVGLFCECCRMCMSSNNGTFNGKFFTQVNGATIGGPESASTMDIFGAIHIDTVARRGWAINSTGLETV